MAALGMFSLKIDGDRFGGQAENTAQVSIRAQNPGGYINDPDADKFHFPPETFNKVALPFTIDELPTDVTTGISSTIGYVVNVRTKGGAAISVSFAAQPAGTTVSLSDVTPVVLEPIGDATAAANRAEAAATDAETAAAAAQAVGNTNDTIIAGRINDPASATAGALSASIDARAVPLPGGSDPVGSVPVKKADGSVGYFKQSFPVDAYATIADAYAALVAAGGGRLVFSPNATYTGVALTLNSSVPTEVYAHGATIKPAANGYAFTLNAGRSQSQNIGLRDVNIDCSGVTGGNGVKIVDHYGAALKNVRVNAPGIGVLITDATGWSESSQFDNVYVKAPTVAGIDIQTNGGTGSFGYANWGFVHIDNIPSGAVGFRIGASAGFSHSTVARLILHSSAATAIGMQVAGNIGLGCKIFATIESLAIGMGSAKAVDVASTGTAAGSDVVLDIIPKTADPTGTVVGWGTLINNPSSRPFPARTQEGRVVNGATNLSVFESGVAGDANPMFSQSPDGTLRWGPGGSGATDVTLARAGVGFLSLTAALQLSGVFSPFGGLRFTSGITTTSGSISTAGGAGIYDATSGSITRTLGTTTTPGTLVIVTRLDSSANTVTIAAPASGSINGKASVTLAQGETLFLFSTTTSGLWVGSKMPSA